MISIRQLIIVALVIGIFWFLGRLRRRLTEKPLRWARRDMSYKETVRCERCGLYLPRTSFAGDMGEEHSCNEVHCPVRHIGPKE